MSEPVEIRILDREYTVACEPQEREGLIKAAHLLDSRMREIRSGNRMAGVDRVAVLAALNLAHELIQSRRSESDEQRRIDYALNDMSRKLDRLLAVVQR